MPDEVLLTAVRGVLAVPQFHGEGYRKVWARLRGEGVRVDKDRVRRTMRRASLFAPQRAGSPHGPKAHDRASTTELSDEMWAADATQTVTLDQGTATIFGVVDHCTAECVGIHASLHGNRFEALEPIRQGGKEHLGNYEKGVALGLTIRHDHGSQFLSRHYQDELRFLGATASPSFVRELGGNGVIERYWRTLKEQLLWVRTFRNVEEFRLALQDFRDLNDRSWILQEHGYVTPNEVRSMLAPREAVAA